MSIINLGLTGGITSIMTMGLLGEPVIVTPSPLGGYTRRRIGARETLIIPIINIIGTPTLIRHPLTTIIGHPHIITHPTTQIIGHPEPLQIFTTQEVISQQTLDNADRQLDQIMKKLSQLDLTEIKEKIKIIANAIKERYEQDQN